MAEDKKKTSAKATTAKGDVKGDQLPAEEAKANEPVEAERHELPIEANKREGVVDHHEVRAEPEVVAAAGGAEEDDAEQVEIAAKQHVQYARKIYKQEPWLVRTVLRDLGPDDTVSKADVRERLAVFLGKTVG